MKQSESIIRLEKALNLWEDVCFVIRKILPLYRKEGLDMPCSLDGPILNAPTFRNYLLKSYMADDFDFDRYVGGKELMATLKSLYFLPLSIFTWTRYSRRVFHLTSELQTRLSAISLERILWKDIDWPFESFIITLDDPLEDEMGNNFDCILVSNLSKSVKSWRENGSRLLDITTFSNKLDGYRKMNVLEKDKISNWAKKGNRDEIELKRERLFLMINGVGGFWAFVDQMAEHNITNLANELSQVFERALPLAESPEHEERIRKLISQHSNDDAYATYSTSSRTLHIVASVCLYIASLPKSERVRYLSSGTSGQDPRKSKKSISDISNVLTVSCRHTLNQDDYAVLEAIKQSRKTGQMKCVHWRRGYWRKKPGTGHDPDAPKVVLVNPCLINRHLLPKGTIPPGSKSIL